MLQKWTLDTGVQEYLLHENTLSIHIGDKELHRVPPLPVGGIRVAYIMFFTVHTKLPPLPRRIVGTWVSATKGAVEKARIRLRDDCPLGVFGFPEYTSLASVTLITIVKIVMIVAISRKIAKHDGNLRSTQRRHKEQCKNKDKSRLYPKRVMADLLCKHSVSPRKTIYSLQCFSIKRREGTP